MRFYLIAVAEDYHIEIFQVFEIMDIVDIHRISEPIFVGALDRYITSVEFSPGGDYIAFTDTKGNINVIDINEFLEYGNEVEILHLFNPNSNFIPNDIPLNDISWYPGNENIFMAVSDSGYILRFYVPGDEKVHVLPSLALPSGGKPKSIAFSPDGKWLAVGMEDGKVPIYKINKNPIENGPISEIFIPEMEKDFNITKPWSVRLSFSPSIPPDNNSGLLVIAPSFGLDFPAITFFLCTPDSNMSICSGKEPWEGEMSNYFMGGFNDFSFGPTGSFAGVVGPELCYIVRSDVLLVDFYNCSDLYSGEAVGNAIAFSPGGDIFFTGGTNKELIGFRINFGQFRW